MTRKRKKGDFVANDVCLNNDRWGQLLSNPCSWDMLLFATPNVRELVIMGLVCKAWANVVKSANLGFWVHLGLAYGVNTSFSHLEVRLTTPVVLVNAYHSICAFCCVPTTPTPSSLFASDSGRVVCQRCAMINLRSVEQLYVPEPMWSCPFYCTRERPIKQWYFRHCDVNRFRPTDVASFAKSRRLFVERLKNMLEPQVYQRGWSDMPLWKYHSWEHLSDVDVSSEFVGTHSEIQDMRFGLWPDGTLWVNLVCLDRTFQDLLTFFDQYVKTAVYRHRLVHWKQEFFGSIVSSRTSTGYNKNNNNNKPVDADVSSDVHTAIRCLLYSRVMVDDHKLERMPRLSSFKKQARDTLKMIVHAARDFALRLEG
eukprot:GILJ01021353.1.p1 GENE.GILJ01021353.1~~GILJ01021353.1.p1  ORF type:complete len:368 (+),score=18.51 GILJ01021353.1:359-1462(+)